MTKSTKWKFVIGGRGAHSLRRLTVVKRNSWRGGTVVRKTKWKFQHIMKWYFQLEGCSQCSVESGCVRKLWHGGSAVGVRK